MERIPGSQPKHLDQIDQTGLAVLGHIIETWHGAQTGEGGLIERWEQLMLALTNQANALEGSDEPFLDELLEDIDALVEFNGSSDEFVKFCEERTSYWVEVRREFIKTL